MSELDHYFNEYKDRGIKKWTGFFLSEHTAKIEKEKSASKSIERLPQQPKEKINYYLDQSIKYNKLLNVQLNTLDDLGNVKPYIQGVFRGFVDVDNVLIGGRNISYDDIRNISIVDFFKWSNTDQEENPFESLKIDQETYDFCNDYFNDGEFIE